MTTHQHPEFKSEQKNLSTAVEWIQQEIDRTALPVTASAADQRAAVAARMILVGKIERLKQARPEPYFGRVDWRSENNEVETFYIGKVGISEKNIYGWRETMPARIFYEGTCSEPGTRLLRRRFELTADRLRAIIDEDVDPNRAELLGLSGLTSAVIEAVRGDSLLAELLEQNREGKLHDIVATIQDEQFRLIRAPLPHIQVIQGVPGSGKTAIALHRLAYLLYFSFR